MGPSQPVRAEVERTAERGVDRKRMEARADIVQQPGQGHLIGTGAAADGVGRFEHRDVDSIGGQGEGSGQAVRAAAHHDRCRHRSTDHRVGGLTRGEHPRFVARLPPGNRVVDGTVGQPRLLRHRVRDDVVTAFHDAQGRVDDLVLQGLLVQRLGLGPDGDPFAGLEVAALLDGRDGELVEQVAVAELPAHEVRAHHLALAQVVVVQIVDVVHHDRHLSSTLRLGHPEGRGLLQEDLGHLGPEQRVELVAVARDGGHEVRVVELGLGSVGAEGHDR